MDRPSTGNHTPSAALDRTSAATFSGRGIAIAGLPVRLVVVESALVVEVDRLFAPMPDHDGPYAAQIVFQADAPAVPGREPDEVYGPIRLWRDGVELFLDSGGPLHAHATPVSVVVGGLGDVAVAGGPGGSGAWAGAAGSEGSANSAGQAALGAMLLRRIVHHVIAHVLSLSGRLVAHGAAVGRQGQGVLMLGASGSGKSSSAYLASLAGWSLLSDDLVVVARGPHGLELVGVHRAIAVPPDVIEADAADIAHDLRDRRRPDVVLDARPHRLAAVALVGHGGEHGSVESVSGLEVAHAFIGSTPAAGNTDVAAEALRTAAALATFPRFRLLLPDTANERLRETAALFETLARSAGIENSG